MSKITFKEEIEKIKEIDKILERTGTIFSLQDHWKFANSIVNIDINNLNGRAITIVGYNYFIILLILQNIQENRRVINE